MTNLQKYNEIFKEVFSVQDGALTEEFTRDNIEQWDSIHMLNLVSYIEEVFNVMLDGDDIIKITSYKGGLDVLNSKYEINFEK